MTPKVVPLQHAPTVSTPVEQVAHGQEDPMNGSQDVATVTQARLETTASRLRELVAHLRHQRAQLREEWARLITEAKLLTAMTREELFAEATSVYDNYVEALETGTYEALQAYARNLSERIIPRGVETHEVVGIVLLLRDVLARSLFATYHEDFNKLNRILDAYEPAANRIAATVAVGFVQERERIIREQQEAIRELSTPVLQVRERLLILPIIGVIDPHRARQLTEQLLRGSGPIGPRSSCSTSPACRTSTRRSRTIWCRPSRRRACSAPPSSSRASPPRSPRPLLISE
jgi:rsbT co-antagonist protein RsbR